VICRNTYWTSELCFFVILSDSLFFNNTLDINNVLDTSNILHNFFKTSVEKNFSQQFWKHQEKVIAKVKKQHCKLGILFYRGIKQIKGLTKVFFRTRKTNFRTGEGHRFTRYSQSFRPCLLFRFISEIFFFFFICTLHLFHEELIPVQSLDLYIVQLRSLSVFFIHSLFQSLFP
jgi:hypothetical protein